MIRKRLTFANVMASVAMFIALGGASYAAVALPRNSVGTKQLRPQAVKRTDLAPRSVTKSKLANARRDQACPVPLDSRPAASPGGGGTERAKGPAGAGRPTRTGSGAGPVRSSGERHARPRPDP